MSLIRITSIVVVMLMAIFTIKGYSKPVDNFQMIDINRPPVEIDAYMAQSCHQFCMPRSTKMLSLSNVYMGGSSFLACVDGCLCSTHCLNMEEQGRLHESYGSCYEACALSEPTMQLIEALDKEQAKQ